MMSMCLEYLVVRLRAGRRDDRGSALVEYGLLVSLVAVACVGAVRGFGLEVSATFQRVADAI